MREGRFCAILFRTARKSLILNGEMSEWSIEHAWKLIPSARSDAHQTPPTQFPSTTSRNNDMHRRVPVNDGVSQGFRGVCDTVLTQCRSAVTPTSTEAYERVPGCRIDLGCLCSRAVADRDDDCPSRMFAVLEFSNGADAVCSAHRSIAR
jgi:hypothetical protein